MKLRILRGLALAAATLVLTACGNVVRSERPLFDAADEYGTPRFRPGVWISNSPDCRVDERAPVAPWPSCADPLVIGKEGLKDPKLLDGAIGRLAAGDPMIAQMADKDGFSYLAIKVLQSDRRGRVLAFRTWPVLCGPPPPHKSDGSEGKVTLSPLPGLEVRGDDCFARDKASVRSAAAASEAWNAEPFIIHWVRRR